MFNETVTKPSIEKSNSEYFQVHTAVHIWEKTEIYKLRYQVYVEEMGKATNHAKGNQLYDELDDRSILLYVQTRETIVATARLTIATAADYSAELADIFQLHTFQAGFNDPNLLYGLCTKLAVKKEYRNSTALYLILSEVYKLLADQNILFWFGGCNPYLVPLYERLGFRRFAPNFSDEGYGLLVPIILLVDDIEYLRIVRSPLYRQARKGKANPETARKFTELFPATRKVLNSRLTRPHDLWRLLTEKLGKPLTDIPAFQYLSLTDTMTLLESSAVFSCKASDCLIEENTACHDLYIILSGRLSIQSAKQKKTLEAGEVFGGISPQIKRLPSDSIIALEASDLLVLPQQSLERYYYPLLEAAATMTDNLLIQQEKTCQNSSSKGENSHA